MWVEPTEENAERLVETLKEFGFSVPELAPALFLDPDRVIRMGHPPRPPSLHFKKIGNKKQLRSVRVGLHYRALGGEAQRDRVVLGWSAR